jgi:hypothetical protein
VGLKWAYDTRTWPCVQSFIKPHARRFRPSPLRPNDFRFPISDFRFLCPRQALKKVPLLSSVQPGARAQLAAALQPMSFKAGDEVIRQVRRAHYVLHGSAPLLRKEFILMLGTLSSSLSQERLYSHLYPFACQGDIGDRFYIVERGELGVFKDRQGPVKTYGPGAARNLVAVQRRTTPYTARGNNGLHAFPAWARSRGSPLCRSGVRGSACSEAKLAGPASPLPTRRLLRRAGAAAQRAARRHHHSRHGLRAAVHGPGCLLHAHHG